MLLDIWREHFMKKTIICSWLKRASPLFLKASLFIAFDVLKLILLRPKLCLTFGKNNLSGKTCKSVLKISFSSLTLVFLKTSSFEKLTTLKNALGGRGGGGYCLIHTRGCATWGGSCFWPLGLCCGPNFDLSVWDGVSELGENYVKFISFCLSKSGSFEMCKNK